jgi:4-hydroxybenzoate polyprenyltransferase
MPWRWLSAWFRLLRISGSVTLLSNALAAWAMVVYLDGDDPLLLAIKLYRNVDLVLWVCLSSVLLYLTGMVWNDILDVERDRVLHPDKPLVSGHIGPGSALVVGCVLAIGSLLAALQLGFRGFFCAGVVLMLIFCYNTAAKHWPYIGSLCMGLVRASHALFVLLAFGPDLFDRMLLTSLTGAVDVEQMGLTGLMPTYPLLLLSYITGVTLVSELESRPGRRVDLLIGGLFLVAPVPFLVLRAIATPWLVGLLESQAFLLAFLGMLWAVLMLCFWLLRIVPRWWRLLQGLEQRQVPHLTKRLLGGMLWFDALCATLAHPLYGVLVLLLVPVFSLLRLLGKME